MTIMAAPEAGTMAQAADAPVLEVRNVETFYGAVMAIRGVSLEVDEGQIVTVLGANGAGKTTLLKTISGVMDPEKGQILLGGRQIQGHEPDEIVRLGVAHVPEGREVFPFLSVEENLRMGAYTRSDDGIGADLEMVYAYFPILRESVPSAGRLPFRRPAADAGDRARPDDAAEDPAARRAVASACRRYWSRRSSISSSA